MVVVVAVEGIEVVGGETAAAVKEGVDVCTVVGGGEYLLGEVVTGAFLYYFPLQNFGFFFFFFSLPINEHFFLSSLSSQN